MDDIAKRASDHASPRRAGLDSASGHPTRPFPIRMRAAHLPALRQRLELPVEFEPTRRLCDGIDVHFMWDTYEMVPTKLVVAYNAPIGDLLLPGQGVIEWCARYNGALRELRALRDRFEHRLRPGAAPLGAEMAQPALSRLEAEIQKRQTARLGSGRVSLHSLQGEIEFWENYRTYLAGITARAERAVDAAKHWDDTADMDPAD